jgi:hypothetical protein
VDCKHVVTQLNDFMDGYLEPAATQAIQEHLADCHGCTQMVGCEQKFRRSLRQLPVELPEAGFAERVFANAVSTEKHQNAWWVAFSAGGGLAMVVMLLLYFILPLRGPDQIFEQLAGVTMAVDAPRTIEMVVNVPEDLNGTTITILLPEHVELDGFPDERHITWTADLAKGGNLLSLPVVARRVGSGPLVARVEHENKRKVFELNMRSSERISDDSKPSWIPA